eukprot:CAMPEP_0181073396 /NCGR_PEP_ID=MMETSP1070-20121207/29057_1 /TAXON_ID=265543 /ORGANISM="Minutocellus polymorphus, Strain NH13" /LENGTH=328 /DNA_ID=CAMNT_0023154465 /DNA_START=51 /DNA_END=1037 /DNA_ORIENTATION=+
MPSSGGAKLQTAEGAEGTEGKRPLVVIVGAGSKHGELSTAADVTGVTDASSSFECASTGIGSTGSDKDQDPLPRGVRWGLGGALPLPFAAEGFDVALLGRREDVLSDVRKAVQEVHAESGHGGTAQVFCVQCDVTDDASVEEAMASLRRKAPSAYIDLLVFNAAPPYPPNFKFEGWGDVLLPHQIDVSNMNLQMDTQVNGLIRLSRHVVPGMIERGRGCVLLSGEACCNLHGGYEFASVAPARAALRSLGQSMFQAYGPMGIHVCNVNIGGIIDSPKTRRWTTAREGLVSPEEIAEQFLNIYEQKKTVWSYEVNLTPSILSRKVHMSM